MITLGYFVLDTHVLALRRRFTIFPEESLSFLRDFVQDHLNDKERKNLKKTSVEPLSLWGSIITIKSHSSVVETKAPLSEGECSDSPSSRLYGCLIYSL